MKVSIHLSDGSVEFLGPMPAEVVAESDSPTLVVAAHMTDGSTEYFPRHPQDIAIRAMLADGARSLGASIIKQIKNS